MMLDEDMELNCSREWSIMMKDIILKHNLGLWLIRMGGSCWLSMDLKCILSLHILLDFYIRIKRSYPYIR